MTLWYTIIKKREGKPENKPKGKEREMFRIQYNRGTRKEFSPDYRVRESAEYAMKDTIKRSWYYDSATLYEVKKSGDEERLEPVLHYTKQGWKPSTVISQSAF